VVHNVAAYNTAGHGSLYHLWSQAIVHACLLADVTTCRLPKYPFLSGFCWDSNVSLVSSFGVSIAFLIFDLI